MNKSLLPFKAVLVVAALLASMMVISVASAKGKNQPAVYRVTVANLTGGQPFTPPIIATHSRDVKMFQRNQPANIGIQEIAENGNLGPMLDILNNSDAVSAVAVAAPAEGPPPLMPGSEITIEITAASDKEVLSVAAMLICTNDGFTGVDSINLPNKIGVTKTFKMRGFDAGTEVNTEDFADIVPPCQGLTGVSSDDAGTGTTNPALAENGVIRVDSINGGNIAGGDDLVPSVHDWRGPVGMIYIERVQ